MKSDAVHSCTETFFIFQEILRAKSDAGALMHAPWHWVMMRK
jgi:hypothetical protein